MIKLTLEKALENYKQLTGWKKTCGLSMKEDLYMQALEIAIPVLEQREKERSGEQS